MWITHQSYPTAYTLDTKGLEEEMIKVIGAWEAAVDVKPPIYWEVTDTDVNAKYSSMLPRFLLEVCLTVKLKPKTKTLSSDTSKEFLRFQMVRCHRELKIDKPLCKFTSQRWQKALHLYCEFGTKEWFLRFANVVVAIKGSSLKVLYLLKYVPDRVSDDSGAMISDVILRMNQYHPQEGRCDCPPPCVLSPDLVLANNNVRVGGGFWRRGAETPSAVKWEDRIIEIREGRWSYIAGSIGRAPEKVVGIAKPKDPPEGWHALWNLSTGNVKLLEGRQMQYKVKKSGFSEETEHVPSEKSISNEGDGKLLVRRRIKEAKGDRDWGSVLPRFFIFSTDLFTLPSALVLERASDGITRCGQYPKATGSKQLT
ncbi:hypothetical protein HAX54_018715 [Datura stramonium]|uniref:GRPD C-terminal domain-containing protein n=1 Tax=Datura stramonium TaxID=4076 RepID=A0ABS8UQN3_DATST|nr:hypothetical protein [Datura stramonium]